VPIFPFPDFCNLEEKYTFWWIFEKVFSKDFMDNFRNNYVTDT
jgi:hypothetical protein